MSETRNILCADGCGTVLGTVTQPDGTDEAVWSRALAGYACPRSKEDSMQNSVAGNSAATVGPAVSCKHRTRASFWVQKASAYCTYLLMRAVLQKSADGVTWEDTAHECATDGQVIDADVTGFGFVRLKVKTANATEAPIHWHLRVEP